MNRKIIFSGMLAVLLMFVACNTGTNPGPGDGGNDTGTGGGNDTGNGGGTDTGDGTGTGTGDILSGTTWAGIDNGTVNVKNQTLTFSRDGKFEVKDTSTVSWPWSGTYSISGNDITFNQLSPGKITMPGVLKNDIITIETPAGPQSYRRQ